MAVYESIAFNVNRLSFMSSVTSLFLDYIASVVSCKSDTGKLWRRVPIESNITSRGQICIAKKAFGER